MPVDDATPGRARVRVVVSNLPAVLASVVGRLIEGQPELALVADVPAGFEVLLAVKAGADVAVIGAERLAPLPGICSHLWAEFPGLGIVVLSFGGEACAVYRPGRPPRTVTGVSAERLLAAIREAGSSTQVSDPGSIQGGAQE